MAWTAKAITFRYCCSTSWTHAGWDLNPCPRHRTHTHTSTSLAELTSDLEFILDLLWDIIFKMQPLMNEKVWWNITVTIHWWQGRTVAPAMQHFKNMSWMDIQNNDCNKHSNNNTALCQN
jgi:hypothetical protein